jgi:hypothetical protein
MPRKPFTTFQKEIAFDRYYAMGEQRDLKRVASELQGNENFIDGAPAWKTLQNWSSQYNWQQRCELRDIENSQKIQAKTDRVVVNTKADYRNDIRLSLQPVKAAINSAIVKKEDPETGEVKAVLNFSVEDAKDLAQMVNSLEKLIKTDLVLMGEADSHAEVSGKGIVFNFTGTPITEDDI